ncbi:unnamed protein product [Victoria cruziana]
MVDRKVLMLTFSASGFNIGHPSFLQVFSFVVLPGSQTADANSHSVFFVWRTYLRQQWLRICRSCTNPQMVKGSLQLTDPVSTQDPYFLKKKPQCHRLYLTGDDLSPLEQRCPVRVGIWG